MNYLKKLAKAIIPEKHRPILKRMYQSLFHLGNRVVCPFCRGHFREFLPAGVKERPNARCPWCGSFERHRLAWLYLRDRTNLLSDDLRLLHFAPEYCLQKAFRSIPNVEYFTVDLDSPLANVRMDITNIPHEDNSFDAIYCSQVLEHILDDAKAMSELFRVLKFDGWAILQVPIDLTRGETFEDRHVVSPKEREHLFGQWDHVRVYGRDYTDRLEKSGFAVRVDGYVRELGDDLVRKYGLDPTENIYFCTKSEQSKIDAGEVSLLRTV